MEHLENPTDRLTFVLGAYCQTKRALVSEYGIGEKAPFTLYAWVDGAIGATAQCSRQLDALEQEKYEVMMNAAFIFRRSIGADAFTLASEGWRARRRTDTPFPERFGAGDQQVEECVVVWHAEPGLGLVVTRPFSYRLGRVTEFGTVAVDKLGDVAGYPATLQLVFKTDKGIAPLPNLSALGLKIWLDQ